MKKTIGLALASIAIWTAISGFSSKVEARESAAIPEVQTHSIQHSSIIPDFQATNFSRPEEVNVTFNSNTQEYTITAPVHSYSSWSSYTIREASTGRMIASERWLTNVRTIVARFRSTGANAYTFVLGSNNTISTLMIYMNHRVTAYEHVDGEGEKLDILGFATNPSLGEWEARISSIRVQPRMKITFYENRVFRNGSRTIMNNSNQERLINLTELGWNDRISSMVVEPITGSEFGANFFENSNQTGRALRYRVSAGNPNLQVSGLDRINSIELYPNTGVELFTELNFSGERIIYENRGFEPMSIELAGTSLNNRISSFRVVRLN
ncbi:MULTISPECIES: hypothetical protein [unclassified Enterococcus]|uniref:hypothetical protein n=1 Tax=unclassified Enterococcus TaxID=2608891 RepID=UPI003D2BA593